MSSRMLWSANTATNTADTFTVLFSVIVVVSFFEAAQTLLHLVYYCFLCQAHQSAVIQHLSFRSCSSYFPAIWGTLKGWLESSSHSNHCLKEPLMVLCLLVKKKIEWRQVRREKHNVTRTMRHCICFQDYCPKLPKFEEPYLRALENGNCLFDSLSLSYGVV